MDYASRDGARSPRRTAAILDRIALFVVILGVGAGLIIGSKDGTAPMGLSLAISAVLVALNLWIVGVVLRWLAVMYELAARGFEPEPRKMNVDAVASTRHSAPAADTSQAAR